MESTGTSAADTRVEFNYYRFNGKGQRPSLVAHVGEAHFMRSRQSVDQSMVDLARQRVDAWSKQQGLSSTMRKPYPSNVNGKYWLEFRFGGLTL